MGRRQRDAAVAPSVRDFAGTPTRAAVSGPGLRAVGGGGARAAHTPAQPGRSHSVVGRIQGRGPVCTLGRFGAVRLCFRRRCRPPVVRPSPSRSVRSRWPDGASLSSSSAVVPSVFVWVARRQRPLRPPPSQTRLLGGSPAGEGAVRADAVEMTFLFLLVWTCTMYMNTLNADGNVTVVLCSDRWQAYQPVLHHH